LARTSGSREGFFRSGLMTAALRADGTWPEFKERFIILVMRGLMAERCDLISVVGKGSRMQVVGFIFLMSASISLCETSEKCLRG